MTRNPPLASKILTTHEEVAYYLNKIIEQLQPEKVILYGSKAMGTANQSPDFLYIYDKWIKVTFIGNSILLPITGGISQEMY